MPVIRANIAKEARLSTDEAPQYIAVGRTFADHGRVKHADFQAESCHGLDSFRAKGNPRVYETRGLVETAGEGGV